MNHRQSRTSSHEGDSEQITFAEVLDAPPLRESTLTNGFTKEEEVLAEPPRKRRKTSESIFGRQSNGVARPKSPPWKKAMADGPTTFVEDGRRKSSRTNGLPLELLNTSDARKSRTNPAVNQPASKSKYSGAALKATQTSPTEPSRQYSRYGRHLRHNSLKSRDITPPTSPPLVRSTSRTQVTISPEKRRPGRPKSQHTLIAESEKLKRTSSVTSKSNGHSRKISKSSNHSNRSTSAMKPSRQGKDADYIDPSKDGQVKRLPKLRFRVKLPELPLPGYHSLPRPRKYASFRDWFNNDPAVKEETSQMSREDAERESNLRQRLLQETEPGGVLSHDRCSVFIPDKEEEPSKQYAHLDHVSAQAIHFRSLMQAEHRRHVAEARKLAYAAAVEVKRRTPKTAEELEQEYHDQIVAAHKQVYRDLTRKWQRVTDHINQQRLAKWEEEQDLIQKQALDNVLEQSSRLLDARMLGKAVDGSSDESETDSDESDQSADDSQTDLEDESNMSTSESNSEDDRNSNELNYDEDLTVDDLRKKYALSEMPEDSIMADNEDEDTTQLPSHLENEADDSQNSNVNGGHVASDPLESEDLDSVVAVMETDDLDEVLEGSDESTDMDTGLEDSSDDDESDEDESDGENGLGLAGFYDSTTNLAELAQARLHSSEADNDGESKATGIASTEPITNGDISHDVLLANDEPADANEGPEASNYASSGTFTANKPSDPESRSSVDLHESPQASSATTPQTVCHLKTAIPPLLRGTLREYQHYGLDWLSNLYANKTNGILADEMGLGKTIQTISLLAHLASEYNVWGPHLVIVPTSVMLNWEMEFKKWCPGFKILTYYGTQERRKELRKGWLNDDLWNVCITSYQLVIQDQQAFKRRNWHFMILDEAHHIKNFQSLKWQTLLTFKTIGRLLLTGTPLQNGLEELWALLFFLMPTVQLGRIGEFASREEFQEWFREIKVQIVDKGASQLDPRAQAAVADLHKVLRPFLLRRLKADVEKQMPPKFEHVVNCRLSKRQRHLYDEFMSRGSTKDALIRGNAFSIMNCVMSLRKVCNHPDLFETRQIVTSFAMRKAAAADFEIKELLVRRRLLREDTFEKVDMGYAGLLPVMHERFSKGEMERSRFLSAKETIGHLCRLAKGQLNEDPTFDVQAATSALGVVNHTGALAHLQELESMFSRQWWSNQKRVIYGRGLVKHLTLSQVLSPRELLSQLRWRQYSRTSSTLADMVMSPQRRSSSMEVTLQKFAFVTPSVTVDGINDLTLGRPLRSALQEAEQPYVKDPYHEARVRLSIAFPDKRLLQYDCGKLQQLDKLLRQLQAGGHRVLIFTQMTKVLDILEQFMSIHGHRYLRLDGQTKIEQRQILTEKFNSDSRILAFILSSRSGGLGINLTGADTVIFYDLDWNPSADKQCQDRCHRIGQTREVHIYRLVSESTIESNILRKANAKRMLDNVVIQEGDFTTDYFNKLSVRDMLGDDVAGLGDSDIVGGAMDRALGGPGDFEKVLEKVEDVEDVKAAKEAKSEAIHVDEADFADKDEPSDKESPEDPEASVANRDPTSSIRTNPVNGNIIGNPGAAVEMPEPEHLDEYLIRFMSFDLADTPLAIPSDKLRAKQKKKKTHVLKRQR